MAPVDLGNQKGNAIRYPFLILFGAQTYSWQDSRESKKRVSLLAEQKQKVLILEHQQENGTWPQTVPHDIAQAGVPVAGRYPQLMVSWYPRI